MQTDIIILENSSMKMKEFCDELLKSAEVIPDDKIDGTTIKISWNDYKEVMVWLEY
jgi:hypothetical protein